MWWFICISYWTGIYIYADAQTYTHTHTHTHTHADRSHLLKHTHTHTHAHAYAHAHTHSSTVHLLTLLYTQREDRQTDRAEMVVGSSSSLLCNIIIHMSFKSGMLIYTLYVNLHLICLMYSSRFSGGRNGLPGKSNNENTGECRKINK